jgi:hypothetical protein
LCQTGCAFFDQAGGFFVGLSGAIVKFLISPKKASFGMARPWDEMTPKYLKKNLRQDIMNKNGYMHKKQEDWQR